VPNRRLLAILLYVIAATCLSHSQTPRPADPQKCALSGKITNKPTNVFSVRLKYLEKNPLDRYDGYFAQVSSDGTFVFEDVAPGKYRLIADAADFVPTEYGIPAPGQPGTPIDLRPGEHRRDIQITFAPKRVVCGKITDEKGTPLPKVEIYALRHIQGIDWLTFDDPGDMRTSTDADGKYRLPSLDPGQYFLIAGMSTWFSDFDKLTQIETETLANAEPVEVGPASDSAAVCPVNFVMRPRLGYMSHRIRGTIADDPALPAKGLVLSFLEVNKTGATRPWPFDVIDPSRSFDLQAPPAGHYRLILSNGRFPQLWSGPSPEFHIFASHEIDITGKEDLNGIVLRPDPHASITGRVTFEELTPRSACPTQEKPQISIQKLDDGQFQKTELTPDGRFSFPFVAPGNYNVRLYPFRRGRAYIKSIVLDRLAVGVQKDARKIALLSPGPHTLEVVLSGNAAQAEGHLPPEDFGERYLEPWSHPKATVSGRVTQAIDHKPPLVKLWSVRFNSNRSYEYATTPDDDGTFHFDDVDPGIYVLLTHGPGYTISEYGAAHPALEGRALTIHAGDNLKDLVLIAAPRQPSLCGRIVDENGKLFPNASIHAWFKTKWGGYDIQPWNQNGPGDGHFQFELLNPGRYFLWASWAAVRDPSAPDAWIQQVTAYPSSPSLDGAEVIDIGFENDTDCRHDIQIRTAPTFHIRGKLPAAIPHAEGEVFDVSLIETSASGIEQWTQSKSALQPSAAFDFASVHSGGYKLELRGPYKPAPGPKSFSGPCGPPSPGPLAIQNVLVENRDLNDVAFYLNMLVSVVGEIRFEDVTKDEANFAASVQFISLGFDHALCPNSTRLSPEGKFSYERLEPGTYRVGLDLRAPLYVKSILLNGQPLEGRHIVLRGGPQKLEIVVSAKGAEVTAEVERTPPPSEEFHYGEPCGPSLAAGPWAFLIPDQLTEDGSGLLYGTLTQDGYFEFNGVPPGHYHAVAGENFNLPYANSAFGGDSAWSDPEFLRAASALGEPVEVTEGQKVQIKLRKATADLQNAMADHKQRVSIYDHCAGGCSYDVLSGVNSDQGMTSQVAEKR
jgi:hypothetical protein